MSALDALLQTNSLVAQDLVTNLTKDTLDLKFAATPSRSEDLAGHLLLILGLLLVRPVLAAALLQFGHLLHGHLGVNGGGNGGPGLLGESALVLETREKAGNTEELLRFEERSTLLRVGGTHSVQDLQTEGLHLKVLNLQTNLLLESMCNILALVGLGPDTQTVNQLVGQGVDALLAGLSPFLFKCVKALLLLLGQALLLLLLAELLLLLRQTSCLHARLLLGLIHQGLLTHVSSGRAGTRALARGCR